MLTSLWGKTILKSCYTSIIVNDANTVNEEPNAIGDSYLMIDMTDYMYDVMRKLSPIIGNQLKIESSNINKFPDIQKKLSNH